MAGISIQNVYKNYGALNVLKEFSLEISDGEFVVLVGPSGCGKSTMLKILAGLEPASGGKILIGDKDVTDLAPGDRDIAMVFQNYALYPHLTVGQNIGFGLKMRGMPKAEIDKRVHAVARILAVEHLLDRRPKALSGVYVTHDQIEAMTMADRVVIMRDGVIQQIADPDTLFARPANLFVAGFIGSPGMNFMSARIEGGRLTLFGQNFATQKGARDGEVIVGIRPEHLSLGQGDVTFAVRPTLVESLGSEKYIYFDPGENAYGEAARDEERGKGLIARIAHSGPVREGDELTLSFDPSEIHLFDPKTEKAVD
ncbi:glycerol-3-phosphate ABC transporter ATP-binding protein [Sinorhizobium medicae]|nr:glycerol-3-phosphate ABC transporter ATP-binding protein [Sinorhizobium medicae]